jgi:hypothetical protein
MHGFSHLLPVGKKILGSFKRMKVLSQRYPRIVDYARTDDIQSAPAFGTGSLIGDILREWKSFKTVAGKYNPVLGSLATYFYG